MKGTIRERVRSSGTVFICQVEAGRDPVTNKRRYRTATARTRREANTLLYELLKEVEGDVGRVEENTLMTLGTLIERWLELGGRRRRRHARCTRGTSRIRSSRICGMFVLIG